MEVAQMGENLRDRMPRVQATTLQMQRARRLGLDHPSDRLHLLSLHISNPLFQARFISNSCNNNGNKTWIH